VKVHFKDNIIAITAEDLPIYKKTGSIVRNNFFWALKSISCHAPKGQDWEFDPDVWVALVRLLIFFGQSGYLATSETILEFESEEVIPEVLSSVAIRL
jgi:hypothetical protein